MSRALRVETRVDYGNACDVEVFEAPDPPAVHFAADPHGGPECLWFCFQVVAEKPLASETVRLVLKHTETMLGGRPVEHMQPVMRTPETDWRRLGPAEYVCLPDGRCRAAWTVPAPRDWLQVAFCYPYGRPEVASLVADSGSAWRADTIGVTQAARPMVRLANDLGTPGGTRPGMYFTARQHSGETPGSWVLDGALRRLAELGDAAPLVWAVPLANLDGVEGGDYGKDNFPWDLNRAWGTPPMRHETLVLQQDIRRWRERCRPVLGLDFHAPGGCETGGAYFYVPDPDDQPEERRRAAWWVDRLADAVGPRYMAEAAARVANYPSRWNHASFRRFFEPMGIPGICLETPYARAGETVLTRRSYRDIGRRLADGLAGAAAEWPEPPEP